MRCWYQSGSRVCYHKQHVDFRFGSKPWHRGRAGMFEQQDSVAECGSYSLGLALKEPRPFMVIVSNVDRPGQRREFSDMRCLDLLLPDLPLSQGYVRNYPSLLRCRSVFSFRRISSCVVNPRHVYLLSISGSIMQSLPRLLFSCRFVPNPSDYGIAESISKSCAKNIDLVDDASTLTGKIQ